MDLREYTVYFRASTYRDLLNGSHIPALINALEEVLDHPFTWSRDLGASKVKRPLAPQPNLSVLQHYLNLGFHTSARFKLFDQNPITTPTSDLTSLEIAGMLHPYMGAYIVSIDLRIPEKLFQKNAFLTSFVQWVGYCAQEMDAFQGHAHQSDDHNAQNMASAAMLKHGFGMHPQGEVRLEQNPGREINRGEFRFAVNWLTLLGKPMIEKLGRKSIEQAPFEHLQWLNDHLVLGRLYNNPLDASTPKARAQQARVRKALDLDAAVQREGKLMGYWNKKSW